MAIASVSSSGEVWDGILNDWQWADATITYSFPASASVYPATYSDYEEPDYGFEALNAQQKTVVRTLLSEIEAFTNVAFSEVTEPATEGTLRFGMTLNTGTAYGYYPGGASSAGDTWYRNDGSYDNPVLGNFAYNEGFMHEIGHALGLLHGHDGANPFGALPTETDSNEFSVMTYRDHVGDSLDWSENEAWGNAQSYMMYDIAALQHMYGADYSASGNVWSGDSVYTFSATTGEMSINGTGQGVPGGNRIFRTIWDGHGEDTYDLGNYATDLLIDLRPGEWSTFSQDQLADLDGGSRTTNLARGNVANALLHDGDERSLIENAIGGTGNDIIIGNQGNNGLTGGNGNDTLAPGYGTDTVDGGDGEDTADLSGAVHAQTVNLVTNVNLGGHAHNDTFISIENVIGSNTRLDDITGSAGSNKLWGMGADDYLRGHNGDDFLYGGENNDFLWGGRGADLLDGGNGLDWAMYNDSDAGVTVDLNGTGSGGFAEGDTYVSIERLRGSIHDDVITMNDASNKVLADNGNDEIYGMGGKDSLRGGNGNDRINGGTGNDTMFGDAGEDIYVFNLGDEADWAAGFENDIDTLELDAGLWGGGLTAQQVVDTYGAQVNANRIDLDFGNGDVLKVLATGITLADLYDDVTIV